MNTHAEDINTMVHLVEEMVKEERKLRGQKGK